MSKETGIPYKTLDDLKNCKTKIENSKVDTLYKISQYFEVSMEEIYTNLRRFDFHDDFEIYKNNLCHFMESDCKGTLKSILTEDIVTKHWEEKKYLYALYDLAMIDYVSKKYSIPLYPKYDYYRKQKLQNPWFPNSIKIRLYVLGEDFKKVTKNAISEFVQYNIYEADYSPHPKGWEVPSKKRRLRFLPPFLSVPM